MTRVGGSHVEVEALVGPGRSHHTYDPTPKQMARLAVADLYFRIGVPFEEALSTRLAFTIEGLDVVNTQEGIPVLWTGGEPGKGKPDPHLWLDPRRVSRMLESIVRTLCLKDPAHAEEFKRNGADYQAELEEVGRQLDELLAPFRGQKVYVFHPAFGYLLEERGIRQVAIEVEGKEPGPRQLAATLTAMRREQARALFIQPQFSSRTAGKIAEEVGLSVVTLDPLAEGYLENMKAMGERICESLRKGSSQKK
ncbi:MAG: zinc ABC transporter substrate-binding protein [Candidatus Omnitrophica bacterium]|nr:zinc ABC transporter substrate-binding protein [Candidatus Omnitrophota bacterium]